MAPLRGLMAPLRGLTLVIATVSLALATFMNVLDTTIANVSIPTIAGALSVSPSQGTWVITSYAVCTAVVVPLTGWLARRFGEVRLFVACASLFSLTSMFCGLSSTFEALTFFRALQGAVAGPMIPLSQALLLRCYPEEKKGLALALVGMTTVVAPIIGPILGGYITDNIGWSWIFYINIPIGLLCSYVTWQILKHRESETRRFPIDTVGLVLLTVGVVSLQMMLDWGNEADWFNSGFIITLALVSFAALSFFLAWEWTEPHPVVDLSLFGMRNFTVATVAISLGYMTFFSGIVVFPLWLQTQMGYTATWAGMAAAPIGVLTLIFMPFVGANLHRVDIRLVASLGFAIFSLTSFWQGTFNTDVAFADVALPRLVQGLGMACFFVPLVTISLAGLPPDRVASASGLTNFMRMLGGSFGTSLSITIWDRRGAMHHSNLTENITMYNDAAMNALDGMRGMGLSGEGALRMLDRVIVKQSVMLATNDVFWLSGLIFSALILFVWLARGPFLAPAGRGGGR